jgi:hypothetical protein
MLNYELSLSLIEGQNTRYTAAVKGKDRDAEK